MTIFVQDFHAPSISLLHFEYLWTQMCLSTSQTLDFVKLNIDILEVTDKFNNVIIWIQKLYELDMRKVTKDIL